MENSVRHEGTIESIGDGHIRVRIVQHSACSACKVAAQCRASEMKEKIVDVYHYNRDGLKVGDSVVVGTSDAMARKALLLGFGLPLLIIVGIIAVMLFMGIGEGAAAITAIGALVPYYFMLWLMRGRISKSISFTIE